MIWLIVLFVLPIESYQSMVNGPSFSECLLPVYKERRSLWQNLNSLFCWVSYSKTFLFFFSKEAMHLFAFHCYPLLHSNSLIYLKMITTHCSKSTYLCYFSCSLYWLTSPSLSLNIEQTILLEFKHLDIGQSPKIFFKELGNMEEGP